jgi:RNA polymerase sigma-70 factor (ECF subfamily)
VAVAGETTILVQRWLNELPNPDTQAGRQARAELIDQSRRRMEAICRKMFFKSLGGSPVDWEDVYQEAAIRLWKSLDAVRPSTVPEFFGLASTQIRRVLVDLCRKYAKAPPDVDALLKESSFSAVTLAKWTEFHEYVETLPDPLRQVVDLVWYQELTQKEAADVLQIDESTVKRRWRKARELLAEYAL